MTRSREEEEGAGEREDSRTVEEYDEEDGDSDLGNEIDNEDVVESILGEGGAVQWGALTGRRGGKTAGHSTPRADARQPLRTSRLSSRRTFNCRCESLCAWAARATTS